ncbi:hypothetical protein Zm00014a_000887 [Zea mays]|uniref:Uncharacterized protein n=1 Tax=Zea mays TaxID=4577 RepID=A0A317Y7P2_MAIZE|nr:hypothetical protein Zm00014a_000887 [Zea mays]
MCLKLCPANDQLVVTRYNSWDEINTREKRKMLAATDLMLWHKVTTVSGVAALGLGTYDAHMFCPKNPAYKEVWHTSSLYHLIHTAALLGAPITKRPNVVSTSPARFNIFAVVVPPGLAHNVPVPSRPHHGAARGAHHQAPQRCDGGLLTTGIVLFSGTCYTVAYLEDRKFSSPAPLGGFAFIAAWASLLCVYYVWY